MRNIVYHQPTGYSPCEYAACVGGFCTKSKIEIEIELELELKIEKTCWGGLYSLRAAKPQALGAVRLCKSKICARRAIGAIRAGERALRHEWLDYHGLRPCGPPTKRGQPQGLTSFVGGPSRTRTLDRPVMSR